MPPMWLRMFAAAGLIAASLPRATYGAEPPRPRPGAALRLTATAYCRPGKTESGTHTHTGIAAADPRVLPVGSVLRIIDGPATGIYTVMDTGPAIKGPTLDLFIPNCAQADRFGKQHVRVRVLRRGWDPKQSDKGR